MDFSHELNVLISKAKDAGVDLDDIHCELETSAQGILEEIRDNEEDGDDSDD